MKPEDFISRWERSGGAELANSQSFLKELCQILAVPEPDPTQVDESLNVYVFEKAVNLNNGDGTSSTGRVDLYRQKAFLLESKQGAERRTNELTESLATVTRQQKYRKGTAQRGTALWAQAMRAAFQQAKRYAEALPEWPPILIICDVGYCFDIYADFSCTGKNYELFPDPRGSRILLRDLIKPEVQSFLRALWQQPHLLDPAEKSAQVTRELADRLARLAKSLEASIAANPAHTTDNVHHRAHQVAQFLMRCLFTMFAEDVELIPSGSFVKLLERLKTKPQNFVPMMESLWRNMDKGGFSPIFEQKIRKFNGGLFADSSALPLNRDQMELLLEAAKANWANVEPAIFGTLLERALDPVERHKLGAHYTPRAYVERLVIPTIVEPLREEWDDVYATATALYNSNKVPESQKCVRDFHEKLCHIRVLDPACGSGNFLYVALELIKKLEGEVIKAMADFGDRQQILTTIDPQQFLGIEVNPRAAAIADLVLWIGYLQWHIKARGKDTISEPIIRKFDNIENRDAILAWDSIEPVFDANGNAVTRWDGKTTKRHHITGQQVPDENATVPELRYVNPRQANWPKADYIVGNPPFIANRNFRKELGDGYVDALKIAFPNVTQAVDFVMYFWQHAAHVAIKDRILSGFITTSRIRLQQNQSVVESAIASGAAILFAVPDHPWQGEANDASVRVALTVIGCATDHVKTKRRLYLSPDHDMPANKVITERTLEATELKPIDIESIPADLSHNTDVSGLVHLRCYDRLCSAGMKPYASTLIINDAKSKELFGPDYLNDRHCPRYVNGQDLARKPRNVRVLDFFGVPLNVIIQSYPRVYQYLLNYTKPERSQERNVRLRNEWWLFEANRAELRDALFGIKRYIVTVENSPNRYFQFVSSSILPDQKLRVIASDDATLLGYLSSRQHAVFAHRLGGRHGVANTPVYNSRCTTTFPLPAPSAGTRSVVGELAERLDAHRKRQQALHPNLTMTGMYNVLEKLRSGKDLSASDLQIHEDGLISLLKQLHDELDAAVFDAYGWRHDLTDDEILDRLVALNHERAEEEKSGLIRWLRPEFQNPASGPHSVQTRLGLEADKEDSEDARETTKTKGGKSAVPSKVRGSGKVAWPKVLREKITLVRQTLQDHKRPVSSEVIAKRFKSVKASEVEEILDTLAAVGQARLLPDGRYVV